MLAGLCAFVLAGPEPGKREKYVITNCIPNFRIKHADFYNSASVSSILAKISSLWDELVPPDSIFSEYVMIRFNEFSLRSALF
jgi:hypothetical protein